MPKAPPRQSRSCAKASPSWAFGEPIDQQFRQTERSVHHEKPPEGSEQDTALADNMAKKITSTIKAEHPDARIDGVDFGSGKVSEQLGRSGGLALLAAMVAISSTSGSFRWGSARCCLRWFTTFR